MRAASLLACLILTTHVSGQPNLEPRVEVARLTSAKGSLLTRTRAGQSWEMPEKGEAVSSRDLLLTLPAAQATLKPIVGNVELTLWGNLPQISPYPLLEASVVLHDTRAFDLDFTLDRGRVVLKHVGKKGAVKVWARLPKTAWEITLNDPGSELALELYGRWRRGTTFDSNPQAQQEPTRVVTLTVLKGSATLKADQREHLLKAAPGPASFHWDSVFGRAPGPQRETKAPGWVTEKLKKNRDYLEARELITSLQKEMQKTSPGESLRKLFKSRSHLARQLAVHSLGAIDDLNGVMEGLTDQSSPIIRETAILTLRHWIGQTRGQDLQLYQWLIAQANYTRAQSETILQLLHSPFDPSQPLTYQALIAFLRHDKLAVRELARWHLYRLVPAGRRIEYDAAGSEKERAKGAALWQNLIPNGKLPPKAKSGS